jgi:hypothetical protein
MGLMLEDCLTRQSLSSGILRRAVLIVAVATRMVDTSCRSNETYQMLDLLILLHKRVSEQRRTMYLQVCRGCK